MKKFAFLALIGASSALKISAEGGKKTVKGNPYKADDPKYQEWEKCDMGDKYSCELVGRKPEEEINCYKSPTGDWKSILANNLER